MITGYNGFLACEVPTNTGMQTEMVNGVKRPKHRNTITPLKVVFGNEKVPAGSTVYLSSVEIESAAWARQVQDLEGAKFVLVPESSVRLVSPLEKK